MTPESAVTEAAKPQKLPETRRINGLDFCNATFVDARMSVSIGDRTCLSITPVIMLPDGDLVGIEKGQTPVGMLVRRRMTAPHEHIARHFIPWVNIARVSYAE